MAVISTTLVKSIPIVFVLGTVSLAGIESGLWSVKGGNRLIPENLLKSSGANLIRSAVSEVKLLPNERYQLVVDKDTRAEYDIVVLAAPQHQRSQLNFVGIPRAVELRSRYHRTVSNFFLGVPNEGYFFTDSVRSKLAGFSSMPTDITVTDASLFFNTYALNVPVTYVNTDSLHDQFFYDAFTRARGARVWKIFSNGDVSVDQANKMFTKILDWQTVDWLAYPEYQVGERMPSFVVHKNFYYVNAIERAASAMEMSIIGGRNVALLARHFWTGDTIRVDSPDVIAGGTKIML